ncbi:septation protein A [Alcaligenaceae bacterium CGII-47]|nr:septation protein A [Alcaligenaceae bacterium CGII-47]
MKKFLFDLFPLILFFVAFKFSDIFTATAVAVAAAILQILWLKFTGRAIEATHWINVTIIVVFGGATLLLHDDTFIKWKPTVLYWMFAVILTGGRLLFKRNLMRKIMGEKIIMPEHIWDRLNYSWSAFFLASGALNLYVAFSGRFTEAQWVNFKVFGLMILLLVFVVAQSLWLGRHIQTDTPPLDVQDKS